ncbi:hypothetical protein PFISCL1PPCAC_21114, partial [Pristionchus fissidentatus]
FLLLTMIGAALRGEALFLGDDPPPKRPRSADDARPHRGLIRSGLVEMQQSARALEVDRKTFSRSGILGQALEEYAASGLPSEYRQPHAPMPRRPSSAPKTGLIGAWLAESKERARLGLTKPAKLKEPVSEQPSEEEITMEVEEYRPAFLLKRLMGKSSTP